MAFHFRGVCYIVNLLAKMVVLQGCFGWDPMDNNNYWGCFHPPKINMVHLKFEVPGNSEIPNLEFPSFSGSMFNYWGCSLFANLGAI